MGPVSVWGTGRCERSGYSADVDFFDIGAEGRLASGCRHSVTVQLPVLEVEVRYLEACRDPCRTLVLFVRSEQ